MTDWPKYGSYTSCQHDQCPVNFCYLRSGHHLGRDVGHEIRVAMHVMEHQLNRRLWAGDASPIDGCEGWDGNGSPCI